MRAQKIFEKFTEDSDPIEDMGIGSINQRKFETEEEFIEWMCEIAIPKILGGWPDNMVPPGKDSNYIQQYYYDKILNYFSNIKNANFTVEGNIGQLIPNYPIVRNWVKKIKEYYYGDAEYRPENKSKLSEGFTEDSDPIADMGIGFFNVGDIIVNKVEKLSYWKKPTRSGLYKLTFVPDSPVAKRDIVTGIILSKKYKENKIQLHIGFFGNKSSISKYVIPNLHKGIKFFLNDLGFNIGVAEYTISNWKKYIEKSSL